MTEQELEKIIGIIKEQIVYEDRCREAYKVIFPDVHAPFVIYPIWKALAYAVDAALGQEDFFDWWIWETDCGERKDKAKIWIGEDEYPVTSAREILAYAEACRKREAQDNSKHRDNG